MKIAEKIKRKFEIVPSVCYCKNKSLLGNPYITRKSQGLKWIERGEWILQSQVYVIIFKVSDPYI